MNWRHLLLMIWLAALTAPAWAHDATPPTVSIGTLGPAENVGTCGGVTYVRGTITIPTTATDDVAIDKTSIAPGGQTHDFVPDTTPASYTFNWATSPDGPTTITATTYDTSGKTGTDSKNVTVDNTPPNSFSLTAPAAGACVSGTAVTVSAAPTDNTSISKVEFYRDSGVLIGTDTTAPYSISWNSTTVSDGAHTLYAIAYDCPGNTRTSSSTSVTVDNTNPTASITSPSNGATVCGTATVTATGSDNLSLKQIEIFWASSAGGPWNSLGTCTSSPCSKSWNLTGLSGTKYLKAVATDCANNTGTSTVISVSVVSLPNITLKEISFTGDHNMYENGDHGGWGAGALIQDPVWKSQDNPDKPVTYTRGSHVAMTVKLGVDPVPPSPFSVTLRVDGPGDLDGETTVNLNAAEVTAGVTTTGTLENKVYKLNSATFSWSVSCCQTCSSTSIGTSSHRIYVTFGTPSPASDLTEMRIDRCVTDALNQTTKIGVADAVHPITGAVFDGDTGAAARNFAVRDLEGKHPDVSTNWYMFSPIETPWLCLPAEPGCSDCPPIEQHPECYVATTIWDIRGSCWAFATLNKMMLDLLGVDGGSVVFIYASSDCTGIEGAGTTSWETTTFDCEGQNHGAMLVYCDYRPKANYWLATLKLSDGGTTRYYGGGETCDGSRPIDILHCDAVVSQFWAWLPPSVSSSCATTYCTIDYAVVNRDPVPVPSCE